MDLSDIIYIICLAFGVLGSVFQYKEKKKAAQNEQRKQQASPADEEYIPSPQDVYADNDEEEYYEEQPREIATLDDIFRALREGRPLAQVVAPEPPAVERTPVEPFIEQRPDETVTSTIKPTIQPVQGEITNDEISDNGIYTDDTASTLFDREGIDWQQAVVTSEILNRKY